MTNKERRDAQMAYISDESVFEEQKICRKKLQKLNFMDRSDFDGIGKAIQDLFGKSEGAFVNPPFFCDYGTNIEVGKNFFANYNCTIIDVAKVRIGDNCQFAPNVSIYHSSGKPQFFVRIWERGNHWRQCLDWRKHCDLSRRTCWKQHGYRRRKCGYQGYSGLVRCSRKSMPRDSEDYR